MIMKRKFDESSFNVFYLSFPSTLSISLNQIFIQLTDGGYADNNSTDAMAKTTNSPIELLF